MPEPRRHISVVTNDARLTRIETALFGTEGRGGMLDEIHEVGDKLDRLYHAAIAATISFATAALGLAITIASHAL